MSEREAQFEKMLQSIQTRYAETAAQMERLKTENKTKTATFRQLMANKLLYQSMLQLYRDHGLIEK